MDKELLTAAKKVWDYLQLNHSLTPSDCILALGTFDLRVAERAAELYLEGMAPFIIMSGGLGFLTKNVWKEKEADKYAAIAVRMGVPSDKILIENQSTNTGENIRFTKKLLKEKGIIIKKLILVQKPYMERRSFATIRKQWPEVEVAVTSPSLSFENYPVGEITLEMTLHAMVGDLQRIVEYPKLGYQILQEVPAEVIEAYNYLVARGYDKRVMR